MPRRRQQSVLDAIFDLLKNFPIWVGPIFAIVIFVACRFIVPALISIPKGYSAATILRSVLPMLSWIVAGAILLAWIAAEFWKLTNRRLLDSQTGLASIRNMSWRDFERLVSEAYRRKGYLSEIVGNDSGDDGVDIRLEGK